MARLEILLVAGARPNFMKAAPVLQELRARADLFDARLVHTGQHYDGTMSEVFFEDLGMPNPDILLGVGSGSHAEQTARIMESFEKVLQTEHPDWVIVVGDVNSTLACALVAAKMQPPVRVAHVEAGLRSGDRTMPEEINRIVTDALADLLFTTSVDADRNLSREGVKRNRIHRVGNVMIDTLWQFAARADASDVGHRLGVDSPFALLTLHRPSNVDDPDVLRRIFEALDRIAEEVSILFPVHPRTSQRLQAFGIRPRVSAARFRMIEPLGYLDFLHLQKRAAFVLTDSGGIQEETSILGVPCLTLRENTERPVTVTKGTNQLVGSDATRIVAAARRALREPVRKQGRIPLWDGGAARRIANVFAALS